MNIALVDILVLLFLVLLFINIIMNKTRIKEPKETLLREQLPSVSVLIPTRNEAKNISACLRGVLSSDHQRYEVIVLDDQSTDNTVQIVENIAAQSERVSLLRGRSIPPHWIGKPHAQFQAAQVSRGQYLLFLDADVILDRKALSLMCAEAKKSGAGILSLFPYQLKEGFWEGLIAPFKYFHIYLLFPTYAMDWPWEPLAAFANGQCMMIERETYKKIGTHGTASKSIREGMTLARTLKKRGGKIRILSGAKIARAKVYGPPPALWDGLTRFLYSLAKSSAFGALMLALMYFLLFALPSAQFAYRLFGGGDLILPAIEIALGMIMFAVAVGEYGLAVSEILLFPLGAFIWCMMIVRAVLFASKKGGIVWKDRKVVIE